ncbi:MAG: GNAT family N-acetyltransferase [Oscillospiraceae bacterium]|nr:GNAT family N-acetyltransferase [Oscillospiraceae bacterium]
MIRKAEIKDISRIAEILVFVKRINYRSIFKNDDYSFNELQVIKVAEDYSRPEKLDNIFVYDDGIVKGLIHMEGTEIAELYVDQFFQDQGIGAKLIEYAKQQFGADRLWAIEKNVNAIRFYEAHGFHISGQKKYGEGTDELLLMLTR